MPERKVPLTRSEMMSRIRSADTKPELKLRKGLHALGFRFRLHVRGLKGSPDIVLPKYRSAIFVHGCFWHGHEGCPYFRIPKTRPEFWTAKIMANRARDRAAVEALIQQGWRVLVVWECASRLNNGDNLPSAVAGWLRGSQTSAELSQETLSAV